MSSLGCPLGILCGCPGWVSAHGWSLMSAHGWLLMSAYIGYFRHFSHLISCFVVFIFCLQCVLGVRSLWQAPPLLKQHKIQTK